MLAEHAFGPYRTILEKVTYSPLMGIYLSHLKNQKKTGSISPDENFAREIIQLFSIGLIQRHIDGSLKLDPLTALPVATYDQADVTEMARIMTGLSFGRINTSVTNTPTYPNPTTQSIGPEVTNGNFFAGSGHRMWQAPGRATWRCFRRITISTTTPTTPDSLCRPAWCPPRKFCSAENPARRSSPSEPQIRQRKPRYRRRSRCAVRAPQRPILYFAPADPTIHHRESERRIHVPRRVEVSAVRRQSGRSHQGILLDYEARSLALADTTVTVGKPKEPLLHFTAVVRGLKCLTGAPLSVLTNMPVTFTSIQSPLTNAYDNAEYNKFPPNSWRFRWFDTTTGLTQAPQSAPSVFNWFLPTTLFPAPWPKPVSSRRRCRSPPRATW
jgi:hypothetical protein